MGENRGGGKKKIKSVRVLPPTSLEHSSVMENMEESS